MHAAKPVGRNVAPAASDEVDSQLGPTVIRGAEILQGSRREPAGRGCLYAGRRHGLGCGLPSALVASHPTEPRSLQYRHLMPLRLGAVDAVNQMSSISKGGT